MKRFCEILLNPFFLLNVNFLSLVLAQTGKLMVSVLIETFASLKLNRPALRNRILLALELNPHDDQEIISK